MFKCKRLVSVFLSAVLIAMSFPGSVFAEGGDIASGTFGTAWRIDSNGVLTISAGELKDWTRYVGNDPPWRDYAEQITEVKTTGIVKLGTADCMFSGCSNVRYIDTTGFDTSNVTNMYAMFEGCKLLEELDVSRFNTSNVEYMDRMFEECRALKNLDVSNFNTSKVKSMSRMFLYCANISELDVSHFNTSSVTSMEQMFYLCKSLSNLDIRSFDMSKVTEASEMFYACEALTELDISAFKKLHVEELYGMFAFCSSLEALDLSYLDTSGVTNMMQMFHDCKSLKHIDVSHFDTSGVTSMTAMFSGCNSLQEIDLSHFDTTNLTSMGEMFKDCHSLKKIDLSNFDVSKVWNVEDLIRNCTSLRTFKVGIWNYDSVSPPWLPSFPVDMKDSVSGKVYAAYSEIPEISNVTYISTDEEPTEPDEPQVILKEARSFKGIKGTINTTGSLTFDFDETSMVNASTTYDHTMARAAAALSLLAYNKSMKRLSDDVLVGQMGYSNVHVWNDKMQDDTGLKSPYMIVHKRALLDGKETDIAIVVIRGTYRKEWIDDFDTGTDSSAGSAHIGFKRAEDFILNDIRNYLNDPKNGFDPDADMKILVTGHSRGAAVANLLGKDLDDGKLGWGNLSKKDIFVYTFATPNTAVLKKSDEAAYRNIFNIVNPEDFVTKVVPSAWGYGRYGRSFILPSRTTDPWESYTYGNGNHFVDYGDYVAKLRAGLRELNCSDEYSPYPHGERDLANYVNKVTKVVGSIYEYYYECLSPYMTYIDQTQMNSLHGLYRNALGRYNSGNEGDKMLARGYMVHAAKGHFGGIGLETLLFFFENQTNMSKNISAVDQLETRPRFATAHMAETYFSAMKYLSEEQLLQSRKVLVGEAHCPVDVTIKDAEGNVIGQIIDNEVKEESTTDNTGVMMSVDGEAKSFSVPKEAGYKIEISGNDLGTMNYSLREVDPDTGEISRVYYQDVPVTTSTNLSQETVGAKSIEDISLTDDKGIIIEPDAILENGGIGELSIDVTVEGIGAADSLHNLNPGDYAKLQAVTDEYNEFLGWYDTEGELLSTDTEYGISVRENVALTAKFTANEPPAPDTSGSTVTSAQIMPAEIVDLPAVKISKPKAAKKKVTVKWKKLSKKNRKKIQGIEIQIAKDKGFTQIVKSTTAGKKKTSKVVKGLKSKTTYYVRVRAYKNAADSKHVSVWKSKKFKAK